MASSEFDGHPFVAGKIRGLRSFRVPPEGNRITGCTFPMDWNPKVNYAKHIGPLVGGPASWLNNREKLVNHEIAGSGCSCGFYGFTDGKNDYDYYASSVAGIIEGYGTVTIGSRGFRASKAKIVALIDCKGTPGSLPPLRAKRDQLAAQVAANKDWIGVGLGLLAVALIGIGTVTWLWPLIAFGVVVGLAAALGIPAALTLNNRFIERFGDWAAYESSAKRRPRSPHLDKLLANEQWQGIPVFHSTAEAIKAFPLGMVGPDD